MTRRGLPDEVIDIDLAKASTISGLLSQMGRAGGFTGRHMAEGVEILEEMCSDKDCTRFLSFPAAPVATGLRGVLREMVRKKLFDVIITASGTLDHDLARSWAKYFRGDFTLDDSKVAKEGFHRLGNVLVPRDSYGPLIESKLQPFLDGLYEEGIRRISSSMLCRRLGEEFGLQDSILFWAAKNGIPVILPAPMDGAVGSQLWFFSQRHRDFGLELMEDEQILSDLVFKAKKTGALMIGGGVTKHHTLWWNQFRSGLDYAVYITTAVEYDGSLSGAPIREAVSWGKVKARARQVTIHGDATVILPFMASALIARLRGRFGKQTSRHSGQ